jgi:hypothetical protein
MMTPAPTFRGRLWRWTKRLSLVTTLAVLTAAPAVGFGLPAVSRTAWARGRAEKALTRAFGTPVQISAMSFSWKSGLALQGLDAESAFHADELTLRPRYSKLFTGKLRANVVLTKPELTIVDAGAETAVAFPRLPKNGLRIEKLEIRDGSVTTRSGSERRTVRLAGLSADGGGRLEDRTLRVELSALSGECDGLAFTGKGTLRMSQEGVSGEIELKEAAAKESSSLQQALRALHLTVRKAPVLSEPY